MNAAGLPGCVATKRSELKTGGVFAPGCEYAHPNLPHSRKTMQSARDQPSRKVPHNLIAHHGRATTEERELMTVVRFYKGASPCVFGSYPESSHYRFRRKVIRCGCLPMVKHINIVCRVLRKQGTQMLRENLFRYSPRASSNFKMAKQGF